MLFDSGLFHITEQNPYFLSHQTLWWGLILGEISNEITVFMSFILSYNVISPKQDFKCTLLFDLVSTFSALHLCCYCSKAHLWDIGVWNYEFKVHLSNQVTKYSSRSSASFKGSYDFVSTKNVTSGYIVCAWFVDFFLNDRVLETKPKYIYFHIQNFTI